MTDIVERLRERKATWQDAIAVMETAADEIERLRTDANRPNLGLATTGQLLDELRARIEMHALGGLNYCTVDGEAFAQAEIARRALEPKP